MKRYYIANANKIGEFQLHLGGKLLFLTPEIITPCFEGPINLDEDFFLIPGYETLEGKFHPCPVTVFFAQLRELRGNKNDNSVSITVVLFSKNKVKWREILIQLSSANNLFNQLNRCVNTLNLYIDRNNSLENLDDQFFLKKFELEPISVQKILSWINQLKMEFYENCQIRVGRDNYFWDEVEISQLPPNRYFIQCLQASLLESFGKVREYSNHLILTYNRTSSWSASHPRTKVNHDASMEETIKDIIKINILSHFDKNVEIDERIKIINHPN